MIKKHHQKIIVAALFVLSFFLNFYQTTEIQQGEDFSLATATMKFLASFDINAVMGNGFNSMDFFSIPLFLILGFSLLSIKITQSFFLALGVVLFYFTCKNHFEDSRKALLASLLLVSFPYFILMKMQEYPFVIFLGISFLFFFSYVIKNEKNEKYIIMAGLIAGIGLFQKILTGVFTISILISYSLCNLEAVKAKFWKLKKVLFFGLSFLLGAAPFIAWNLFNIYNDLIQKIVERKGVFIVHLPKSLMSRFFHLQDLFTGLPPNYLNNIYIIGAFMAFVFFLSFFYLIYKKDKKNSFYLLAVILFLLFSSFPLNPFIVRHLYILIPLLIIIMLSGIFVIVEDVFKSSKIKNGIASGFIVFLILLNLYNTFTVITTENEYNLFLGDHLIGMALRDKEIDKIYLFQPENYGFWNSIHFTTMHRNVYLAYHLMEGENIILHGHWDGNIAGGYSAGQITERTMDSVLAESAFANIIYIDTRLPHYDNKNIFRHKEREHMRMVLKKNDYQEIVIVQKIDEPGFNSLYKKKYYIWIHKDQNEIIDSIEESVTKNEFTFTLN